MSGKVTCCSTVETMSGVEVPLGFAGGGFGDVREARICFNGIAVAVERLKQIEESVEHDAVKTDKYVKEFAMLCRNMFRAAGALFEQEHLIFVIMVSAVGSSGAVGGSLKCNKGKYHGHPEPQSSKRR